MTSNSTILSPFLIKVQAVILKIYLKLQVKETRIKNVFVASCYNIFLSNISLNEEYENLNGQFC